MIVSILIGREGSVAFPGKNVHPVVGRPLAAYPMLAARHAKLVDEEYLSTDSDRLKKLAESHGCRILERPPELATKEALAEDAYAQAYRHIKYGLKKDVEIAVLLFCNAPTILAETIDEGIRRLMEDPTLDSAVTVSIYNMWSPIRARRIGEDGLLRPFVPLSAFGDLSILNCDRDSQGDVYFADMAASIVRARCLEDLSYGVLPQRWMGRRIHPLIQWGGCDVDQEWQLPSVEFWLRKNGFTETATPYDQRI